MMTISEFCELHSAYRKDREWVLANCRTMKEVWDTIRPSCLVWVATRPGVLTDKELRLFAVHCARSVQHLMEDARSRHAVDVAERYAHGDATDEELAAASAVASATAWAAQAAVASATAEDAATVAAWNTAWDAVRAAQAEYLRANTTPNFGDL